MKRFQAEGLLHLCVTLAQSNELLLKHNLDFERFYKNLARMLEVLAAHFEYFGMNTHTERMRDLIQELRKADPSKRECAKQLTILLEMLPEELKKTAVFIVTENAYYLHHKHPHFGPEVAAAFPKAKNDIRQAHRCIAVEAPEGSIYYSMMVLERGLKALAKKLSVPFDGRSTWGPIIDKIQLEITSRLAARSSPPPGTPSPTRAAAAKEKKFLEACQNAAIEFRFFKNIWRDHIAHGGGVYGDEEAERVLEHVRNFMRVMAIDLKLKQVK